MAFALVCPQCRQPMRARQDALTSVNPAVGGEISEIIWTCDACGTNVSQKPLSMSEDEVRDLMHQSLGPAIAYGLALNAVIALLFAGIAGVIAFLFTQSIETSYILAILVLGCTVALTLIRTRLRMNRMVESMVRLMRQSSGGNSLGK